MKDNSEISLKVAEAVRKDVGRGLARIDPADIEKLHATVGDIVEIVGKRSTVAKIMPAFKEERGMSKIQIDGLTRGNAQISLDEKILVRKRSWNPANNVVLVPMNATNLDRDSKYIGSLLDGLPVIAGDRIRATLFGSRFSDFIVESTTPKGIVIINPTTVLKIDEKKPGSGDRIKFSYEDIGGLSHEIQRIREMIELPLKHPEVFERLGIDAPKGVLLYGPPGCGKTLIARAVANETEAYFITINGPEIIHKFYGESEARLREIFEDAKKHAPSIIFLDEIDAIAPKREHVVGDVEKRVVAQLLALMDGLDSRGHVIVIAATNIPGALDPALRRPGRFDREISIPIPDKKARFSILEIHSRGMPLSEDVSLDKLAEITHGFVGADLQALCREAAMLCLRKVIPEINFDASNIPYETLMNMKVCMEHFIDALKEVEPSALREVFVEIPDVGWEDVGGLETIKQQIREAVEWPLKYTDLFTYAKISSPRGILLYGPPGTGKTLMAKAVANETKVNFISIKGPALISKYVGESERGIRDIFKKAKQAAPCIIFFDELDVIVPKRGEGGDSHVTERVIGQFLTEMDGIEELKGVLVLAATNRMEQIDPALLRAGRFDYLIEIPIPDADTRLKIFQVHTHDKPLEKGIDLKKYAWETEGMTGADIELICKRAVLMAIRSAIAQQKVSSEGFIVTAGDFGNAVEEVKQRVSL
ncbi:MAG: AAA family ATPase [Candidatus Jettenia sp.]|uniref:Cell division protein ATPase n=1 Tax=Candidatus Jettenia caeni TaxID=247490 RepID=I3IH22_9BACT|nr:CDC48 family AAA ATPase [Candidatus Jettenia sp. AMX1]MBC6929071.1 AAA family ATPase [Candidatus Jettenia sp.]WKZ16347.1 MAG: CDC48 family AAA ATPase [Candidatus Jettenia caeni]KAA0249353.1 MAG: AAA family ATPase [Candidatus Jettenia sp. AMX1]MCE7880327.1 AAA family ATPase [Candidatus Jettenia sp. AMX1]MDL1939766.1 AAA family ATPase [Candidatus Jettenia sp. AMX1]